MADDKARFGGGTTDYEAQLERKRAALRRALKGEYIRQRYHPHINSEGQGGHVFDAAIQRWNAMKATEGEFFYPTFRNFFKAVGICALPIGLGMYLWRKEQSQWELRARQGLMAYDHPDRIKKWGNTGDRQGLW